MSASAKWTIDSPRKSGAGVRPGEECDMTKEQEIMQFLHEKVFDPILNSTEASSKLEQGVRLTIVRMEQRDALGMVDYFWAAVTGTEKSIGFAKLMKDEGFDRFEEAIDEFRSKFSDLWLGQ